MEFLKRVGRYTSAEERFCTRCPYATERCRTEKPTLREVKPGHSVACFRYEEGKQA